MINQIKKNSLTQYKSAINPRTGQLNKSSANRSGVTSEPIQAPELLEVLHTPINVVKWLIQVITNMASGLVSYVSVYRTFDTI